MFKYLWKSVFGLVLISICTFVIAEEKFLQPDSWSFPEVVESARKISPKNVEGITFNKFGLAYSSEEVDKLNFSTMNPEKLQVYADIVTHAYPEAIAKQVPKNCASISVEDLNNTAIAGIAYVSIHAKSESSRNLAGACLIIIQEKLRKLK